MPTGTIIAKASGKKAPDKPEIPLFEDTPFITQNRILQNQAYRQSRDGLQGLNVLDTDTRNSLQNVADQYTQNQWSDLNRNYNKAMNRMAQENYNRFGGSSSTPALYNTDSLQRSYNDLASETAAKTAKAYNNLINNEYNRRLANYQAAYGTFNTSGGTAYKHDYNNYLTQVRNTGINYENEVNDYNNDTAILRAINKAENTIGGAVASIWLGPIGGALGQAAQGIDDSLLPTAYADTAAYGYTTSPMYNYGSLSTEGESPLMRLSNLLGASYGQQSGWGSNIGSGKTSKGTATSATPSIVGGSSSKGYIGTLPKL